MLEMMLYYNFTGERLEILFDEYCDGIVEKLKEVLDMLLKIYNSSRNADCVKENENEKILEILNFIDLKVENKSLKPKSM